MRTISQKPDCESTAAYAASQPLFDALRNATAKAGEQKLHLAKARDLVQSLHVKLVDTTGTDGTLKQDQYVERVMKAWTSATEAYCSIFEELCRVTAPDATEGREAGKDHGQFKIMADTAAAAMKEATKDRIAEGMGEARTGTTSDKLTTSGKRTRGDDELDEDEEQVTEVVTQPSKSRRKRDQKRARLNAQSASATGVSADSKPLGAKVNAEGIEDKTKQTASRQDGKSLDTDPEPVSADKENKVPVSEVEYEDVSAEVAARLKAKEERKKAKKEERKRKRESRDSAHVEAVVSDRPSKKRPKTAGAPLEAEPAITKKEKKRRQDDGGREAGEGPKKRVKSKA